MLCRSCAGFALTTGPAALASQVHLNRELDVFTIPNDLALPRVTYANSDADVAAIHQLFDRHLPNFKQAQLGAHHANFTGGDQRYDGVAYAVRSPINRKLVLGTLFSAGDTGINGAVAAATVAFLQWRNTPLSERVASLRRVASNMQQRRFDIGARLILEVGKIRMEAMAEVEEAIDIINYYCNEAERTNGWSQSLLTTDPRDRALDRLRPFGVFAVISPFNFPFALSSGMIAAALLAGNTVVWKPAEMAALTAPAVLGAFAAGELPPGVFNMIAGGGDTGAKLVAHLDVAGVAFTGSYTVGMSLYRAMAHGAYVKPFLAELGGKNATFVCASSDIDVAAKAVARAAFAMSGQKCSACSKVYVDRLVQAEFSDRLTAFTSELRCGDPELKTTYVGPVINDAAGQRFDRAVADAKENGEILLGGRVLGSGIFQEGTYLEPTIVAGLSSGHWINRQELFAPLLSVISFSDLNEAIADSNAGMQGLTAGIYTGREVDLESFLARTEAGVLYANRPSSATTGAWPGFQVFGGWKGSGTTGKGAFGPHYVQQFMREQSLTIRS